MYLPYCLYLGFNYYSVIEDGVCAHGEKVETCVIFV